MSTIFARSEMMVNLDPIIMWVFSDGWDGGVSGFSVERTGLGL